MKSEAHCNMDDIHLSSPWKHLFIKTWQLRL